MVEVDRVKDAMRRAGLSQAGLARAAGVSAAAIQQILNGKTKRPRAISDIAEALKVSTEWLEGKVDDPTRHFVKSTTAIADADVVEIPYLLMGQNPSYADAYEGEFSVLRFSRSWIKRSTGIDQVDKLFMARTVQTHMIPTLSPEDDIIMYISNEFDKDPDSIWFCKIHDQTFFRRIRMISSDRVSVIADNPRHPAFEADMSEVLFIGKVLWNGRRLSSA